MHIVCCSVRVHVCTYVCMYVCTSVCICGTYCGILTILVPFAAHSDLISSSIIHHRSYIMSPLLADSSLPLNKCASTLSYFTSPYHLISSLLFFSHLTSYSFILLNLSSRFMMPYLIFSHSTHFSSSHPIAFNCISLYFTSPHLTSASHLISPDSI